MKELLCLTFICAFLAIGVIGQDPSPAPKIPTAAPTQAPAETTAAPTQAPAETTAAPTQAPAETTVAPTPKPKTTTTDPTTPPTTEPKTTLPPTTPPTTEPKTTPAPTTPPTPEPNTTLAPTTAPTPEPNTTLAPNTTIAPNTTVAPVTSTVAPTPSKPTVDNYIVNGTNTTCLLMNAAIEFTIGYEGKGKKNMTYKGFIGKDPKYSGSCEASTDKLVINAPKDVTLEITFKSKEQQYSLYELVLTANSKHFKEGIDKNIVSNYTNTKKFQLNKGDYYTCKSQTTLQLTNDVTVSITNLELEAFRTSNTTEISGKRVICPKDQTTNSIVPIAVGAALAGLVVVVLIAYLIGRKRSRRGYESV